MRYRPPSNRWDEQFEINYEQNLKDIEKDIISVEDTANVAKEASGSAIAVANQSNTKSEQAVSKVESVQEQFNQVVIDGDSSVEAAQARVDEKGNVFTSLKEHLDDKGLKIESLIKKDIYSKKTYGTYNNAGAMGVIANEDDPKMQILGFPTVQSASTYSDRDSASLYVSNRSTKPTVVVNTGTVTYTTLSVKVTGVTIVNLDKIEEGMMIDTYHTPNRWTSIVDSVDINNQIITIKDGWFQVKDGGSQAPSTPPNGVGFDVNRITKIWGVNNNVFLYPEDTASAGVAEEIGLFNSKEDRSLAGVDIVNFHNMSNYAFQGRQAGKEFQDVVAFENGIMMYNSNNAYVMDTQNGIRTLLRSFVNGDSDEKGFFIYADGTANKQKLFPFVYENGQVKYHSPIVKIFLLNKTVQEDFMLPSPVGKSGESIYVMNYGNVKANLTCESGAVFITGANNPSKLGLYPQTNAKFISDGGNWYAEYGNFDNYGGYLKQTGGVIKGTLSIDSGTTATGLEIGSTTIAGDTYLDFHSSGKDNDFDVRVSISGGTTTPGKGAFDINASKVTVTGNTIVTVMTGSGSPLASITPAFIGQDYVDTSSKIAYKACGTSANDWKQITN